MAVSFQLDLTASQVNQAINAAHDSDQAPASGDTNLVNSDKIAAAIAASVGTVVSDVATLDGRVTTLEGASISSAAYVFADGTYTTTGVLGASSGWSTLKSSSFCALSSGVVTISSSGVYVVMVSGTFTETDNSINDTYSISINIAGEVPQNSLNADGSTTWYGAVSINSGSTSGQPSSVRIDTQKTFLAAGGETVSITANRTNSGDLVTEDVTVTLLKLS